MKPNTSRWRDNNSYDFFDSLPIEGLAWECLRRSGSYQRHYTAHVSAGTEWQPLPMEGQKRWGLRFPGPARSVRLVARRSLVASRRPCGPDPYVITGRAVGREHGSAGRARPLSKESAG
ncbi:DUF6499 domain-containing protein [Mesorhizobium sp. M0006]|uniref:transcriptional regulator domain-containing protein n=1 Tax=Mesorhizobium sp. M0006 TaxID=2956838 RepID=UPI00333B073C